MSLACCGVVRSPRRLKSSSSTCEERRCFFVQLQAQLRLSFALGFLRIARNVVYVLSSRFTPRRRIEKQFAAPKPEENTPIRPLTKFTNSPIYKFAGVP